jgi:hypothetical protein
LGDRKAIRSVEKQTASQPFTSAAISAATFWMADHPCGSWLAKWHVGAIFSDSKKFSCTATLQDLGVRDFNHGFRMGRQMYGPQPLTLSLALSLLNPT